MSNDALVNGTRLLQPWTNDEGMVLGSFHRQGKKWWTVYWKDAGTMAHPEADLLRSMSEEE